MQTPPNDNGRLDIPSIYEWMAPFRFELQPIMSVGDNGVHGYEMLYRGVRPDLWSDVDRAVLSYFAGAARHMDKLFINLSNESILSIPAEVFIQASAKNDLVYELSESLIEPHSFEAVTGKVDKLTEAGLRFAIDDFGNGHDGLKRIFALKRVEAVKIDGDMVKTAMHRPDARTALQGLIAQWRESSIFTIAEGIERPEIMAFACEIGVDLVQGWHVDALVAPPALLSA